QARAHEQAQSESARDAGPGHVLLEEGFEVLDVRRPAARVADLDETEAVSAEGSNLDRRLAVAFGRRPQLVPDPLHVLLGDAGSLVVALQRSLGRGRQSPRGASDRLAGGCEVIAAWRARDELESLGHELHLLGAPDGALEDRRMFLAQFEIAEHLEGAA